MLLDVYYDWLRNNKRNDVIPRSKKGVTLRDVRQSIFSLYRMHQKADEWRKANGYKDEDEQLQEDGYVIEDQFEAMLEDER